LTRLKTPFLKKSGARGFTVRVIPLKAIVKKFSAFAVAFYAEGLFFIKGFHRVIFIEKTIIFLKTEKKNFIFLSADLYLAG
jgi:hypothetical protein